MNAVSLDMMSPLTAAEAPGRAALNRAAPDRFAPRVEPGDGATNRRAPGAGEALREAADELVGMALLLPLLKQARASSLNSDLFHGGQAEEAFGAQLDQAIADRLIKRSNMPLADATYRRLAGLTTAAGKGGQR